MPSVHRHTFTVALLLALALPISCPAVRAAEPAARDVDPAKVLAYMGAVELTQVEIDAVFSKLPEEEQLDFIRDGAKVDQLIRTLLKRKAIAADAVKAGYDKDPLIAALLRLEAEKDLAEAWLQNIVRSAPPADYEVLAHEDYVAHPDAYNSPETLDVSHILIGTEGRSVEEARQRAASVEAELRADPARFDALVMEYSDDPAKADNHGRYADMERGMMVAPFEEAAFALKNPGEISEPVQTDYGFHIIRLNGRKGNQPRSYAEVKDEAVVGAQLRYLNTYRENYLLRVLADPIVIPDGAVEIMAKRHFGENLELAPR